MQPSGDWIVRVRRKCGRRSAPPISTLSLRIIRAAPLPPTERPLPPHPNSRFIQSKATIYRDLCSRYISPSFMAVGEPPPLPTSGDKAAAAPQHKRVLLFAGHMIDAPEREHPRFPADKEQVAREKIKEMIVKEMNSGAGVACGYAGGASGGDILFHEVCAELGISTRFYLAIPPQKFVTTSVQKAVPNWVDPFWKLYESTIAKELARFERSVRGYGESEYLPAWLRPKPNYDIW